MVEDTSVSLIASMDMQIKPALAIYFKINYQFKSNILLDIILINATNALTTVYKELWRI